MITGSEVLIGSEAALSARAREGSTVARFQDLRGEIAAEVVINVTAGKSRDSAQGKDLLRSVIGGDMCIGHGVTDGDGIVGTDYLVQRRKENEGIAVSLIL